MKLTLLILLIISVLMTSACSAPTDAVLDSLGKYENRQYYSSGGFQDFTDYAKYTYEDIDISYNSYFEPITSDSKIELIAHIDDFEKWIEIIRESEPKNEVVIKYDFDPMVISDDDYLYIYDDPEYPEFGNYDVYYFDTEALTLYYFHNNI